MPWDPKQIDSKILAVHAAFLNYDQIIFFGGDQHDPNLNKAHSFEATCLFDCNNGSVTKVDSPHFDAFCAGHALSANGTLLVAGGTYSFPAEDGGFHEHHFPGLRDTAVCRYEPTSFGWRHTADLNTGRPFIVTDRSLTGGRWYPTLITLANGDVLAVNGHPGIDDRSHINYIPEVFTPSPAPEGSWHALGSYFNAADISKFEEQLGYKTDKDSKVFKEVTNYPRLHLLDTGHVLLASPNLQDMTVGIQVNKSPWSADFVDICKFEVDDDGIFRDYRFLSNSSVLLPLRWEEGFKAKILLSGGPTPYLLNLKEWQPGKQGTVRWRPMPDAGGKRDPGNPFVIEAPLNGRVLPGKRRRLHGHAVLLPTGEVLHIGGVEGVVEVVNGENVVKAQDSSAVLTPEIYDSFTGVWKALTDPSEQEKVVRNYHSVALLMPDGRVWTAGSDKDARAGVGFAEHRIEIYEPWYFRSPDRPVILQAPDRWRTGEKIVVETTQADRNNIARVVMLRTGSCTHAFNPDQRYISLHFEHEGGNFLSVDTAPNGNVAPTGMYFLFTVNKQNLPSAGITIYHNGDPHSESEIEWDALFR